MCQFGQWTKQGNWDLSLDSSSCSSQYTNCNNSLQSLCVLCSILGSKVWTLHWLNILWWALAFNFSCLLWYKHQFDVPSPPYCWDHPWTPTWTLKIMYKTLRFSMLVKHPCLVPISVEYTEEIQTYTKTKPGVTVWQFFIYQYQIT